MNILLTGSNGYIGSAISLGDFLDHYDITFCEGTCLRYQDLTKEEVRQFDTVIHLAGHSSVSSCDEDPTGSLHNNVIDFFHFVNKLSKHQKLIYASSASVYGHSGSKLCKETDILPPPLKEYDRQKQMIDYYMLKSNKKFYGLRFGTVCGASPNMRNELLINSMTRDAILKGTVTANNAQNLRSVLGMKDLVNSIQVLIEKDIDPGVYNLASFSATIGDIGAAVAKQFDAGINGTVSPQPEGYSFCMSTSKFQQATGFHFRETPYTIAESVAKGIKKK